MSATSSSLQTPHSTSTRIFGLPITAVAFLLLTLTLSLLLSHYRLLWINELLVLNQDDVPSLKQLFEIERSYPLSLDPPIFHLLAHADIHLFGPGAFAVRLPSLVGYQLMQICLFLFARRIASERVAFVAMAIPSMLYTSYYAVDGRPYGMQLGFYSLALLCWQTAIRRESSRLPALIGLGVALAIAVNAHYYGPLLLMPLYGAEAFRSFERRKLDLPLWLSLGIGAASMAFFFPFLKAASAFREHYLEQSAGPGFIAQAYTSLLVFPTGSGGLGRTVFLALLVCFLLWACVRVFKNPFEFFAPAEFVLVLGLIALPIFGFLLAHFVTHSMEVRYVLAATLGIALLEAVALARLLDASRNYRILVAGFFLLVVAHGMQRAAFERKAGHRTFAGLMLTPGIKTRLLRSGHPLYIQDLETLLIARFYEEDPQVRSRLALVYSYDKEMQTLHHDTYWLNATHLSHFTDIRTVTYESLASEPGDHIFILLHDRYQWIDAALATSHISVQPLGPALSADAVAITFPPDNPQ